MESNSTREDVKLFWRDLIVGFVVAGALLYFFTELSLYHEFKNFDQRMITFIRDFTNPALTTFFIIMTNFGSTIVYIILIISLSAILYFYLDSRWEALMLFCSLLGGWLLNVWLKETFERVRPELNRLIEASGYSFPSGHAMVSMAFYGMLCYILVRHLKARSKPYWYVIIGSIILIALIGISRIYLGVHYPSDVIGGFVAGGIWVITCILALQAITHFSNRRSND